MSLIGTAADEQDGKQGQASSAGQQPDNQGDSGTPKDEERTVPYSRLQKEISKRRDLETRYENLEKKVSDLEAKKDPSSAKYDPNMDFDKAMEQIRNEAAEIALQRLKSEQETTTAAQRKGLEILDEGFDLLRDEGNKITAKDEEAISAIAEEYGIQVKKPEDLAKAFKIFDLQRKSAGAGKAKGSETPASDPKRSPSPSDGPVNVRNKSWSDLTEGTVAKLKAKLGG